MYIAFPEKVCKTARFLCKNGSKRGKRSPIRARICIFGIPFFGVLDSMPNFALFTDTLTKTLLGVIALCQRGRPPVSDDEVLPATVVLSVQVIPALFLICTSNSGSG
jgi:hypothetical protein